MTDRQHVELVTDDGVRLAADARVPRGDRRGAAVICHPHPGFGGTRESWIVPVLQKALAAAGWWSLRFDFRGAGGSEGTQSGGHEEVRDVAAAIGVAEAESDGGPVRVGGGSFGAAVSLRRLLADDRASAWFGVAVPWSDELGLPLPAPEELADETRPLLFIHGSEDQFCPADRIRDIAARAPAGRIEVLPGADHFLQLSRQRLVELVTAFASEAGN